MSPPQASPPQTGTLRLLPAADSLWASGSRACVLAIAALLLAWPLTFPLGLFGAFIGGLTGALGADWLTRRQPRLRLPSVLLLCLAVLCGGMVVAWLLVSSGWLATLLGPLNALQLSQAVQWFFVVAGSLFALRFSAQRWPLLAVFEVTLVAASVVTRFAAHRDGMVHRPLRIGDWAWSRGVDPVFIFLFLGGLGSLLLAAMLVSEDRRRRLPLHFLALLLVALGLLVFVRTGGLPKPQPAGDLGLTGEPEDPSGKGDGAQGKGSSAGDDHQMDDLPFKDDYGNRGSQAPVAVVLLHDDYSPPSGVYYFRQTVFSQYNGQRLVQATIDDVDQDIVRSFPSTPTVVPLVPPLGKERKPLRTSTGLLVDHVRPFALDSPARFSPTRNPNPQRFQRAFEVLSHVQTLPYDAMIGRRPGNAGWTDAQWRHYTEAPKDDRYLQLAEEVIEGLRPEYRGDPLAQALAVKEYLDVNGIYSRKSKHADSGDPAASFLFGDLTGYCVHFAHAATYLFRSRGIPARVAAGYAVSETSRGQSSSILIRGADAHAWPEIYLEDIGWVVVDLSPQQSLDEPWDEADPELQRMLGDMLRQKDWQEDEAEANQPLTLKRVLAALALLLALLLEVAYAIKLYRRLMPPFGDPRQTYRTAFRAALDSLADAGWRRRYGESREEFSARVSPLAPAFGELTQSHLAHSLGSEEGRRPASEILLLSRRTAWEIGQSMPPWRRLLAALHPWAWLFAR